MQTLVELTNYEAPEFEKLDIENKIRRYMHLKNAVKEYNGLKDELKKFFKEVPESVIGPYKVTGKWCHKKSYEVPAYDYWDMRIKEIL